MIQERAALGWKVSGWVAAEASHPEILCISWTGRTGLFDPLPSWRAPLWRLAGGALELLVPEGRYRAELPLAQAKALRLFARGARGWCSKRGICINLEARPGVWFDQHGIAQRAADLDEMSMAPQSLACVDASGQLARWELTDEGLALAWLDDSFPRGPFSVRMRSPWLIVSNGSVKVAYWVGPSHWCWPMAERGLLRLMTGRGGGWEPEAIHRPVMMG